MTEVVEQINGLIDKHGLSFTRVPQSTSILHFTALQQNFGFDYSDLRVWDRADINNAIISYGDDWDLTLKSQLDSFSQIIYLAVTDDSFYPWPIYVGEQSELLDFLGELPFFEYFVFDQQYDKVLFDTHHNSLIIFMQDLIK